LLQWILHQYVSIRTSQPVFLKLRELQNALSRTLQLLSTHPEIQDKLREELIDAHTTGGQLSYDTLVELPYLDAICRETLRL
jgi:cytochrome P450